MPGELLHPIYSHPFVQSLAPYYVVWSYVFRRIHIPHHASLRNVLTTSSPGRWLVSQILKLLIAYITLHYDIQPLEERPLNTIFGDTNIPSMSATIRVRRRKSA